MDIHATTTVSSSSQRDEDADASHTGTEASKFEIVPLYKPSNLRYMPYMPIMDRQTIAFPIRPPILKTLQPKAYPFDNALGGRCIVFVSLKHEAYPNEDLTFPLQLAEYMKLKNGSCYTIDDCHDCDFHNREIHEHNQFVTNLLTEIIHYNGCQVNAGKVTEPGMPDQSAVSQYNLYVKEFLGNECMRMQYGMQYLHDKIGLSPMVDYELQDAIQWSDEISFYRNVLKRIQRSNGKLRLKFPNEPPVEWDGLSLKHTALSGKLMWIINDKHCCKFPNCKVASVPNAFADATRSSITFEGLCEDTHALAGMLAVTSPMEFLAAFEYKRMCKTASAIEVVNKVFTFLAKGVSDDTVELLASSNRLISIETKDRVLAMNAHEYDEENVAASEEDDDCTYEDAEWHQEQQADRVFDQQQTVQTLEQQLPNAHRYASQAAPSSADRLTSFLPTTMSSSRQQQQEEAKPCNLSCFVQQPNMPMGTMFSGTTFCDAEKNTKQQRSKNVAQQQATLRTTTLSTSSSSSSSSSSTAAKTYKNPYVEYVFDEDAGELRAQYDAFSGVNVHPKQGPEYDMFKDDEEPEGSYDYLNEDTAGDKIDASSRGAAPNNGTPSSHV